MYGLLDDLWQTVVGHVTVGAGADVSVLYAISFFFYKSLVLQINRVETLDIFTRYNPFNNHMASMPLKQ